MIKKVEPMITESSLFNARIYKLHKKQKEIYDDKSRFKVVVAGRRFGKSKCALSMLIKYAVKKKKAVVWYVAPTYSMARDIMWPELTNAIPRNLIYKKLENRLEIQLINGSLIKLYGADKPDCYDNETEILTEDGWVYFRDLQEGKQVLTLNQTSLKAEWKVPYKYVHQHYEGDMWQFKNGRVDLLVTPEHKFFTISKKGVKKFKPIEDINFHHERIPSSVGWNGLNKENITDEMAAMIGFYVAEGCAYGNSGGNPKHDKHLYKVTFCQSKGIKGGVKGDVYKKFKDVLDKTDYKYNEKKDIGFEIQKKELWEKFIDFGNVYTKRIPKKYKDLPPDKLRIILEWAIYGDGCMTKSMWNYYTVSKQLADDIQEIAIKCGYSATIHLKKSPKGSVIDGRVIKSSTEFIYDVSIHKTKFNYFKSTKENYVTKTQYSGMVHCVGVENHVIMVRRNGKVCWSGNTLRGKGVDFVVLDEFQDFKLGIWDNVIYPTLTDKYGHALIIGTPKLHGELKDMYYRAIDPENSDSWRGWQIPTAESPFIPKSELEQAKKNMDEKAYKREFEASLEDGQGRIYYNFDRRTHSKPLKPLDLSKPLYIGVDFNVDPMTAIIFQLELAPDYKYGSKTDYWEIHVKDEITLSNSNVSELCDEIDRRYYRWGANKIGIYPDPAGKARTQTRGESNFQIFKQRGFVKLFARNKHPAREDRFNSVNFMLKDANGRIRMYVDPKCKNLIKSLEQTIYKPGTNDIDKSSGIDHWTDALGYPVEMLFPIKHVKIMGVSI